MRQLFLATLLSCFLSSPALAQNAPPPDEESEPRTSVIADQEHGVIRFIIEGREVMRIDGTGLHVRDHINYGGALTSYGRSGFDMLVEEVEDVE